MSAPSPTSARVAADRRAVQSEAAAAEARETCRNTRRIVGKFVRPAQAALGCHRHGVVQREGALGTDRERALGVAEGRAADVLRQRPAGFRDTAQMQMVAAEDRAAGCR